MSGRVQFKDRQAHFWSGVERPSQTACWTWHGGIKKNGYGFFSMGRKNERYHIQAHRVAFQLRYGKIPEGLQTCHICDNRRCVNPSHMFLGTHLTNAQDREKKGRGLRGERQNGAKLRDADIPIIRRLIELGLCQRQIAKVFGVSPPLITLIKKGQVRAYQT